MSNQTISISCLTMILAFSNHTLRADEPTRDAKPFSEIASLMESEGYLISEATYKKGDWEVEALKDGTAYELRLEGTTGKVRWQKVDDTDDPWPPNNAKPLSAIAQTVEKTGYVISEVDYERNNIWEVEAYKEGVKYELKLNALTGALLIEKLDT
ncbi:PepSY domain-containing protein [Rubellicoccus peritrichatus]|uniref:PepSY domain-containing protein n=1 Tax=Rubellicoccus peritrichatus TaxID=3080537 RepID=A0AAQ3L9I5_9BACT|nr:PepSY domain-containing protein [Puniceicoccus sp. CR14]WOO41142.1 PepSY domain-containing protein [Puniceicoccus sp. CR14]